MQPLSLSIYSLFQKFASNCLLPNSQLWVEYSQLPTFLQKAKGTKAPINLQRISYILLMFNLWTVEPSLMWTNSHLCIQYLTLLFLQIFVRIFFETKYLSEFNKKVILLLYRSIKYLIFIRHLRDYRKNFF